jgi:plasmid stabilization system protein ParE
MAGPAYRVIVSLRAFDDPDAIIDYILRQSPANAARVIDYL